MSEPAAATERSSATAYWGARADEYNEYIVRVVPRYREMQDRLLDYAPLQAQHVLELGTGTGNLALRLVERWPAATFTFVDGAPEMIDITRERLLAQVPDAAARMQFLAQRFESLQLPDGGVDVVIAALSLHHVPDVAPVYQRIAPALARGGRLVMLDGLRGETEHEHAVHMARWHEWWDVHLSAQEIREAAAHVEQHDHYRSLTEHRAMLHAAGFAYTDCVWRDGLFTLIVATKA